MRRHVDQRERVQQGVALLQTGRVHGRVGDRDPQIVAARHPLRLGDRPRGPADGEDIVGRGRMRGGMGVDAARVGIGAQDAGQRADTGGQVVAQRDDVLHAGELRLQALHHRHVVVIAEAPGGDEDLRLGQPHHVPQFVRAELHRQRAEDRADARARQIDDHQLDDVRQLHHDDVVLADARLQERLRQPVGGRLRSAYVRRSGSPGARSARLGGSTTASGVRRVLHVVEEQVDERPLAPPAACGVLLDLLLRGSGSSFSSQSQRGRNRPGQDRVPTNSCRWC